ncbi:DUF998 domain-containing protein [Streptomyces sp. GESEQ-35]|uniref:DUF998 domain-containing protein n=1 Tax=Streptomyces sp. GESEQ-35 TaxID=2812657 RepID=UPI001B337982|nr:DUF998 domain-containing protein [Streptomyces sp. GESEQ-35]
MLDASGIRSLSRKAGAVALIVAAVQYVALEAVAASAWKDPPYQYSFNFISDLGVPSCGGEVDGRTVCSPLHVVMNTGFVVQGVSFVVAAVLLFPMLPDRLRWIYLALAVVHGAGITLVGLVHGSPEAAADGSMTWHILGAMMAIFGGNLVSIVVGRHLLGSGTARWLGITGIVLGAFGLVCALLLQTVMNGNNVAAVFERGGVYPIMVAEFVAGVALLAWRRPGAPLPAEPRSAGAAA